MNSKENSDKIDNQEYNQGLATIVFGGEKVQNTFASITAAMADPNSIEAYDDKSDVNLELTFKEQEIFERILSRESGESKYQIIGKLASGGMGDVYRVYDKDIKRQCVLKVILPELKDDESIIKRFIHEAWISGLLEHPNIIPLHDLGFIPGHGIYFTLTFVHGESLYDVIDNLIDKYDDYLEKYDLYTLIGIVRKVCDAVSYAHSKNILHRDIKPENIMIGKFGEVVLMDWGISKVVEDLEEETSEGCIEYINLEKLVDLMKTQDGIIKGTPAYMSPEQASGSPETIDQQSDVFLLGATLYHMFTYQTPYSSSNIRQVIRSARDCNYILPEDLGFRNKNLSKELCRIINKAMARQKKHRYQTAQELADDLDDLIRGKMEYNTLVFKEGEYLAKEGDWGADSYVLLSGKVQVQRQLGEQKIVLDTIGAGDIVGEMALINDEPRTLDAIAMEETEVLVLNKETFRHNLKKLPPWMENTVISLANRLKVTSTKLTDSIVMHRDELGHGSHPFQL